MMDRSAQILGTETSKATSVNSTLRRLWQHFRKYGLVLVVVGVLVISSTYMQVLIPDLIGQAVDCYLGPYSAGLLAGESSEALSAISGNVDAAGPFSNCWYTTPDLGASAKETLQGFPCSSCTSRGRQNSFLQHASNGSYSLSLRRRMHLLLLMMIFLSFHGELVPSSHIHARKVNADS